MHMIDVMKKLQEIAEDGYDNEDIQRGIDAAGKHTVAEAQSPAQKAAFQKMLDAKKGDNVGEGAITGNDDDDEGVAKPKQPKAKKPWMPTQDGDLGNYVPKASQMKALEGTVSEKVSNLYPSDPGQDDEGDDEGSNPRLKDRYYPNDPGQDDEGDPEGANPRLNPNKPIQKDADIERLKKTAGITSGGFKPIYNVDGSLADIAKDSGYTSIGGAKPAPDISVNPGPTPIDGNDPGQDDEGDDEGSNPRLNPAPDISAITGNDGDDEGSVNPSPTPSDPGQDDEGDDEGSNHSPGERDPDPLNMRGGMGIKDYMKKHGIKDRLFSTHKEVKQGKYDTSKIKEDDDIQEVHEDGIDEAVVEVPVNELAELMQLAGYTDYAEKIEEYANEPEEDYMDAEEQLIGLSGGLNGPKKMYAAAAGGDNPMDQEPREVTESTFESFYKKYDKFVAELTESEQDK